MLWSILVVATWARMASRPMTGQSVPEACASRYAAVALGTGSLVPGLRGMGKSCSSNTASGVKVEAKSSQLWWSALYAYLYLIRLICSMARSCSAVLGAGGDMFSVPLDRRPSDRARNGPGTLHFAAVWVGSITPGW